MSHRRFIALFTAVAAAAVAGIGMVVPAQAATTAVPDPGFAACLNGYLGQAADAPITAAQLQGLTGEIDCYDPVGSLEGAQDLTGIDDFRLETSGFDGDYGDLSPLSGLTGLTRLWITGLGGFINIQDLSPLAGLTGLTDLQVNNTQINDVAPLAGLTNLTNLSLDGSYVGNHSLAPLAGLTKLTSLDLAGSGISDVGPLSGLTGLTMLFLQDNSLTDVTPLAGLTGLKDLDLAQNYIQDVTPLAGLTGVTAFNLSTNWITDLSPLAGLTGWVWGQGLGGQTWNYAGDQTAGLTVTAGVAHALPVVSLPAVGPVTWTDANGYFTGTLAVTAPLPNLVPDPVLRQCIADAMHNWGTGASPGHPGYALEADSISQADLDALAAASTAPYDLNCGAGIATLEGLQFLHDPELATFSAGDGTISDLTPLAGLTSLTSLYLVDNQISDLTPLAGLTNLTDLTLQANQIKDVAPLGSLSNLTGLNLSSNQISDLTPLAGLTNLQGLILSDNQISDLSPLSGMTGLVGLYADSNQISDLTPLAGVTALTWLILNNNQVSDLSPLAGLTNLFSLQFANNQVSDISPLAGLSGLVYASFQANHVTDVSPLAGFGTSFWLAACGRSVVATCGSFSAQTASMTVTAGVATMLPVIPVAAVSPIAWTVASGTATVSADGMVTMPAVGTATLTWTDANGWFTGTLAVTAVPAPTPSVPNSTVAKSGISASTTGGAARLANGKDPYTMTVSVVDTDGHPMAGVADRLAVTGPAGVTVSGITDNGDGTYSFTAESAKPGNYLLTVTLDGTVVGSPIPVNFIGATDPPTQQVGATQTATGLGFLPGEKVTVTVHSTPLVLGTFTADSVGTVHVSFPVPADFADSSHTVTFAGATSGTVTASFTVPALVVVPGGGTGAGTSTNPAGFVFASLLALAGGVLVRRLRTAR